MSATLGPHTIKENMTHNKLSRSKTTNQIGRILWLAYDYVLKSWMRLSSIFLHWNTAFSFSWETASWFWSWCKVNNNPSKKWYLASHQQHFDFPSLSPIHPFTPPPPPPPPNASLGCESWWNNVLRILVHKHCHCPVAPMALKCLSTVLTISWKTRDRKGKAGMNIHKPLLRSSFVEFHWIWFSI